MSVADDLAEGAIRLDFRGRNLVRVLRIGGELHRCGTWGGPDSGAMFTDPVFSGRGVLELSAQAARGLRAGSGKFLRPPGTRARFVDAARWQSLTEERVQNSFPTAQGVLSAEQPLAGTEAVAYAAGMAQRFVVVSDNGESWVLGGDPDDGKFTIRQR